MPQDHDPKFVNFGIQATASIHMGKPAELKKCEILDMQLSQLFDVIRSHISCGAHGYFSYVHESRATSKY